MFYLFFTTKNKFKKGETNDPLILWFPLNKIFIFGEDIKILFIKEKSFRHWGMFKLAFM